MKQKIKVILTNIFYPLVALLLVIAVWAVVAKIKDNPLVLPMPSVVLKTFFTLGAETGFWQSVGWSILRTIICFCISFVLALICASIGGIVKPFHKVLSPIVTLFRAAPTVAVILIMYAFLNNNSIAIVVGFLIAFPIMYSAFYSAITNVDKDLLEMATLYKVKPIDKIKSIYLPTIAPTLFDTSKSTISLTLKVVVASEILACVSSSLGGKIQVANASAEISYLLAWTMIAIVFSFVLEGIVCAFKKICEVAK